jgi:hypothetical protein
MPTTKIYDDLLAQVTDELQRNVLITLIGNPSGMTRYQMVMDIFGYWPENLSNDQGDRLIRKAIEALRKDWPIVSNSGEAGYRLTENAAEIDAYALEQSSRAARELEKAKQAYAWLPKIRTIQEYRKSGVQATQEVLL